MMKKNIRPTNIIKTLILVGLILSANFASAASAKKSSRKTSKTNKHNKSSIENSIFEILTDPKDDTGAGKVGSSSVIEIMKEKYLLTNFHVCSNAPLGEDLYDSPIEFKIDNHKTKFSARFTVNPEELIFIKESDLCLIPVSEPTTASHLADIPLAHKDSYNQLTLFTPFEKNTIKKTKVVAKDNPNEPYFPKKNGYKIDFPIEYGMSGSPVLNNKNEIVMVVWGRDWNIPNNVMGLTVGLKSINELIHKAIEVRAAKLKSNPNVVALDTH